MEHLRCFGTELGLLRRALQILPARCLRTPFCIARPIEPKVARVEEVVKRTRILAPFSLLAEKSFNRGQICKRLALLRTLPTTEVVVLLIFLAFQCK